MKHTLSVSEVNILINKAEESFHHEECSTSECYLGYLTQMGIDSDQEGKDFLKRFQSERDLVHSCLGCDPCPPGILYANYLRKRSKNTE